ncbi:hypothetical protein RB595_003707 [Gaeumannomyces hyphopodioides]
MPVLIRSCPRLKAFVTIFVPNADLDRRWLYDDELPDGCEIKDDEDAEEPDEPAAKMIAPEDDELLVGMHHLARFKGLAKLTDIVEILLGCPNLEEPTLSFSEYTVRNSELAFNHTCGAFFRRVCLNYSKCAARHLRLKVLRFRLGVVLRRHLRGDDEEEPGAVALNRYLSGLTDMSMLEEVYVKARRAYHQPDDSSHAVAPIPWEIFTPDCAPALRRIGQTAPVRDHPKAAFRGQPGLTEALGWRDCPCVPGNSRGQHGLCSDDGNFDGRIAHRDLSRRRISRYHQYLDLASNSNNLFLITEFDTATLQIKYQTVLESILARTPGLRVLVLGAPWPELDLAYAKYWTTGEEMEAMIEATRRYKELAGSLRWRKALAARLAEAETGLRIIKIGRHAWRVWRGNVTTGRPKLLGMDRAEQRRLGGFRPPCHMYPEFAMSMVYQSLGKGRIYEGMMW